MFAKKKKLIEAATKKPKTCARDKIERALKEVKQLSVEAEDFFHTVSTSLDKKDEKDGK